MTRYTFSDADRRKGGLTTSKRYDMQERGRNGLQALANKYFQGDIKKAGKALSRIGLWSTDPAPWNRAWTLRDVPKSLIDRLLEPHYYTPSDEPPF